MADGPLALCPQDARGLWDGLECVGDVNVFIANPSGVQRRGFGLQ
jgi:hypothetical protein